MQALEYLDKCIDELEAPLDLLKPGEEVAGYPVLRLPRRDLERTKIRRLEMLVSLHQEKVRLLDFSLCKAGAKARESSVHDQWQQQQRATQGADTIEGLQEEQSRPATTLVRDRLHFWESELRLATQERA
jgi:hypothetical protein